MKLTPGVCSPSLRVASKSFTLSKFGLYFSKTVPTSYAEVMGSDEDAFNRFFHAMLDGGVYLAPSAFEAGFVSAAHTEADIDATIAVADKIFSAWK